MTSSGLIVFGLFSSKGNAIYFHLFSFQIPVNIKSSEGDFTNNFFHHISNSMEITFFSHPSCSEVIAMKSCTWHNWCADMACAKFCSYMTPCNGGIQKAIFHWIQWIKMEKSFLKWVPGQFHAFYIYIYICAFIKYSNGQKLQYHKLLTQTCYEIIANLWDSFHISSNQCDFTQKRIFLPLSQMIHKYYYKLLKTNVLTQLYSTSQAQICQLISIKVSMKLSQP